MQKPYLSIVIPAFNSKLTIVRLLDSIFASRQRDLEVIVVNDGSNDNTKEEVNSYIKKKLPVILISFKNSSGPARARNTGAKKATGEVLLFLDSDVIVQKGTIKETIKGFKEDKYRVAMTGVWDKKQSSNKLFPKFKALRDWSYWINERKANAYYYLFSTRIAAIRRDVFLLLGGFDESFKGADVEDIEFTYRIAKRYRIDFNEKMKVFHDFEDFWIIARKYFKRSFQWVGLFLGRKKFDPVATTSNEAISGFTAVGTVVLFLCAIFSKIFLIPFFIFLFWHFWGVRKFLRFVKKEEGFLFALYSLFIGIALYIFIFAGASWAILRHYFSGL